MSKCFYKWFRIQIVARFAPGFKDNLDTDEKGLPLCHESARVIVIPFFATLCQPRNTPSMRGFYPAAALFLKDSNRRYFLSLVKL